MGYGQRSRFLRRRMAWTDSIKNRKYRDSREWTEAGTNERTDVCLRSISSEETFGRSPPKGLYEPYTTPLSVFGAALVPPIYVA